MAFRWMGWIELSRHSLHVVASAEQLMLSYIHLVPRDYTHSKALPGSYYHTSNTMHTHSHTYARKTNGIKNTHHSNKKDDGMSLRLIMLLFFLSLLLLLSLLLFVSTWNAITLHHVQNSIQWNHCRIDHHLLSAVEKNAGLHSNCEIFTWKFESFPRNYLVQRVLAFSFTLLHFRQSSKVYGICMHTT